VRGAHLVKVKPLVDMEDFHCDTFDLNFQFKPEEINRDAFLKAVSEAPYVDENTDNNEEVDVGLSFGSREQPPKLHAHLRVRVTKERGRADLSYHASPMKVDDVKPPHAEELMQWLSEFFTFENVKARVGAKYDLDESFSPVIALPFPLVTSEKGLTGSLVTGMSLLLPKEPEPLLAIIQSAGDETDIFISTSTEINLRNFDLLAELKRLSKTLYSLVKQKQEVGNEKGTAKKDE